jgi:hypothetical protein
LVIWQYLSKLHRKSRQFCDVVGATAIIFSAFIVSSTASAQKFQEPTREELQMTSDPKAPGAPAVYLYREEVTDNYSHYVSGYARIKVFTELGKEWATVKIPHLLHDTGTPIIEGRTIHSDGTVIPLSGKAADMLVQQQEDESLQQAVFNLPSVETGSILEYRWTLPLTGTRLNKSASSDAYEYWSELARRIPRWEVQQDLFVHQEHFYYKPYSSLETGVGDTPYSYEINGEVASYLMFTQRLPEGAAVQKGMKGDYSLDIQNVPASESLPYAPPQADLDYHVSFYFTPYQTSDVYWENEAKRWSKQMDQFASQDQAIKDAANQIVASTDSPETKARKLYDAVQTLENTDFTRVKSDAERKSLHLKQRAKNARDVSQEKSGSSNEIAALYLALARAVGLDAYAMKVSDRDQHIFEPKLLSLDQLDSILIVVRIDGKDVYLDPGEKLCPFGQLHWAHTLAGGISQNAKSPVFTLNNLSKDAITAHTADLTVDAHGQVTGTVKVLMRGPEALHWRQLNLTADEAEVRKQFQESLGELLPQGIAIEIERFQGLESYASDLLAIIKVAGSLGSITGKRILLPAFFFSTRTQAQFVSETRRSTPVDFRYAEQVIDDVIYRFPSGLTAESLPPAAQLTWPEHAALVTRSATGPGMVDIKHIFARASVLLDAKEYPALREYYQKLAVNDQQSLVLAATASSTGN